MKIYNTFPILLFVYGTGNITQFFYLEKLLLNEKPFSILKNIFLYLQAYVNYTQCSSYL